jgi:transcriptional regulator with XRE-family HTH domain
MPDIKTLSTTLKAMRKERGMSLREFSKYLGISHAYLSKLERGSDARTGKEVTPTIDTLEKISEGLNIPIKKFMDMCGYFEFNIGYLEESGAARDAIEIGDFVTEVANRLLSAERVTYAGDELSPEAVELVADSLRIGKNLALKKCGLLKEDV